MTRSRQPVTGILHAGTVSTQPGRLLGYFRGVVRLPPPQAQHTSAASYLPAARAAERRGGRREGGAPSRSWSPSSLQSFGRRRRRAGKSPWSRSLASRGTGRTDVCLNPGLARSVPAESWSDAGSFFPMRRSQEVAQSWNPRRAQGGEARWHWREWRGDREVTMRAEERGVWRCLRAERTASRCDWFKWVRVFTSEGGVG